MGINTPNNKPSDLQVGPTSDGMVRIHIFNEDISLPIDFLPEDANDIAEEILAASRMALSVKKKK
jgi:hypothetical protein